MSCNLNAASPEILLPLFFLIAALSTSKIDVPLFRVCRKVSSSACVTANIRSLSVLSSGYCGDIAPIAALVSSDIIESSDPNKRILRIVRRIIRRRT